MINNFPKWVTISTCVFWIGLALSDVHSTFKVHSPDEQYGWTLPLGIALLILPIAVAAYLWGKENYK
jgi:hypothetical protein